MAKRIKILDSKLHDATRLSGLYFVIDGEIYPDMTDGALKHNSHINFFQTIVRYNPQIKEKYKGVSYLEFPRGLLMRDQETNSIMLSGPDNMNERQIKKILRKFRYNTGAKYTFEYDEHYTKDYVVSTIGKKLAQQYSPDMVKLELMEVEEFFTNQMSQF